MIHTLKSWPQFFEPLLAGDKTFEARKNDRNFSRGDVLVLREWVPAEGAAHFGQLGEYTGREIEVEVTYILRGYDDNRHFGVGAGFVVMGIKPIVKPYVKQPRKKVHHHASTGK